jgi:pimeloyl-ACP methyl ester carboxylesterase
VTPRMLFRIAIALAALGYVAYAYLAKPSNPSAARIAAPIPARATEFTLGTLHFAACDLPQKKSGATTRAYCAPFSVPENRAQPQGRTIALKLALIRSAAAAADSDIVVFLAGGPGQAAIDTWPEISYAFAPLLKHHHVLLLDQRGTGGSNPLDCAPDSSAADAAAADSLDPLSRDARTRACLAVVEKKADPRYYTTTDAIADLENVRQALGAPPFDLVGVSYGTRVAQQYLMHHPDAVRSAVLDSVAPNELVLGEDFATSLESALKAQFALCIQTPACAKAFGDPYASLGKLRAELRARPRDYEFHDPVSFRVTHRQLNEGVLAGLVRMFAYTPESAALLPLSISEGLKGNIAPLVGQAQVITGDLAGLADSGMQLSVICSEDADLLKPRPEDADLVLGTALIDGLKSACAIWPKGTRPADFHSPLQTDKPVLVLEGELDPVTPPRYGEQVLKGLRNGRLLLAKGQGHNVIGRGCIPKLVGEFVEKLDAKALDAKCVDALGPMPAFIDFNGSSP